MVTEDARKRHLKQQPKRLKREITGISVSINSFLGPFTPLSNFLKRVYKDETGAVTAEYVIITSLLVIALIGAASVLADATHLWFWRKVLRIIKY